MAKEETYSKRVKSELALLSYSLEEEKGILSGFIRYVGSYSLFSSSLKMSSSNASVMKLIFNALKDVYKVKPRFTYQKQLRLEKNTIYVITVEEKVKEILEDLEIVSNLERVKLSKMLKKDYVRGFMVGTFLASGQLSNPSRGSYFLELCFNHEDDANRVLKKLTSYKDEKEMNFKLTKRREKYVVYLKKSDQIPVFLSMMSAISMMLDYENERLTRDFFNNENRLMICSQANYGRTLKTGEKNLEDIKIIEDKIGSVYFEDKVKILVDLRKENKDASYQELADLAISKGIQITKSGVVHIFKKIEKDAEKLK